MCTKMKHLRNHTCHDNEIYQMLQLSGHYSYFVLGRSWVQTLAQRLAILTEVFVVFLSSSRQMPG
jgi:hypothetical protein